MQSDSGSGSASTVSREDNLALSSEDSSSTPDDCGLGLSLGLFLGIGNGATMQRPGPKILTAYDLPGALCSSSASSTLSRVNGIAGSKRTADSVSPSNASSQVVGWPPIRAYRMNSLANPGKSPSNKESNSTVGKDNTKSIAQQMKNCGNGRDSNPKQGLLSKSSYVKVNMDGVPIGRKVDLSVHDCYEKLAHTLDKMFDASIATANSTQCPSLLGAPRSSKLLDGSSGYVLTYEDKEGDWMLVGDVPWG
ncbi:hypothetical protein CDL15_Pgr006591 [Punica granatum]|nr:hypothetical protein CDL15_Pgr006591 [Punica granatum]